MQACHGLVCVLEYLCVTNNKNISKKRMANASQPWQLWDFNLSTIMEISKGEIYLHPSPRQAQTTRYLGFQRWNADTFRSAPLSQGLHDSLQK